MSTIPKRFRVALSFPGEKRDFVKEVATVLASALDQDRVLYDEYYTAEFARPNLDTYLGRLYHQESELLVPFLCADYETKEWCGLEWRQMRDLLKQKKDDHIMPFRFDDAPISGVLSIDGYVKIGRRTPQEVAILILERLSALGAAPAADAPVATRPADGLSADATKLLLVMAEAEDASLLCSSSQDGYGLTVGGQDFLPDTKSQRERAKWQRAIRELVAAKLIEEDGPSGEIFVVTDPGFETANALKVDTGNSMPGKADFAFVPTEMENVAQYFRDAENLIADEPGGDGGDVSVKIPAAPAAFLRVYPVTSIDELPSELVAKRLATGKLFPMGVATSGCSWSRNALGAVAYTSRMDSQLTNFSQLFVTREICGVDLQCSRRVHVDGAKRTYDRIVLEAYKFELSCVLALKNFVKFTRESLGYAGAIQVMAGLQGIKGAKLSLNLRVVGDALRDEVRWAGRLGASDISPEQFLRPLFEKVWDSFGVTRFVEADQQLAAHLRS